ncbi:unnamed protein product [Lactuca saligna]|uniref:Uncharacterized protein n=1 Tax=Lactuca saligna TaxID=75948 RepID=A0AA36E5J5_LACSI|nr:unnamed protein product [Lactuca saligna]
MAQAGPNGLFVIVELNYQGVFTHEWFDDDDNPNDEHESCIDGENKDNINDLRNMDVEFNKDAMIMNMTSNDPFLSKLCVDEDEDKNIVDDDGR